MAEEAMRTMHELKNALQIVKALVYLARKDAVDRYDEIQSSVSRMEGILRGYLASALPLGEPAPVGLDALVRGVVDTLGPRAAAAGVMLSSIASPLVVDGDARRLREALLDLTGNAIEATPSGGRVEIDVAARDDDAVIEIRDTGKGIPADNLRRLGGEIFTTRDGGTGLGVVLARSVVIRHGGTLEHESTLGVGTTARITLPIRDEE